MNEYIITSFVLICIAIGIRITELLVYKYPKTKTEDKSAVIIACVIYIGFAVWAGSLIFS